MEGQLRSCSSARLLKNALKESQEIFSNVATYAPVPIAIIEADGRYQFVNQKFTEVFGYDLHDFTKGKEWFSLAYPDPEYRKKVIAFMEIRSQGINVRPAKTRNIYCTVQKRS